MKISVVGLGKMGLPFAVQCASKGFQVNGCDVDSKTVALVNAGIEPFPGEKDLDFKLADAVKKNLLRATEDTVAAVAESDVVVVLVPLYVNEDGQPSFEWIDAATESIGKGLKKGTLVSYETTLPIGTTRNRFAKALEKHSGLVSGSDFYVAFSPERVYSGRVFQNLREYPKLTGGIDDVSEQKAAEFYSVVLDFDSRPDLKRPNGVWRMGGAEAAEFAKLAETTYRDVNIALANQFAKHASEIGIDIYKVIEGCNSQPYSHIHNPGIAVGGHCIPIYPQMYLLSDDSATIVRDARATNKSMPQHAVNRIKEKIGSLSDLRIGILGVSYRGGVKEHAFSGVFDLVQSIRAAGAEPFVSDPLYDDFEITSLGLTPITDLGDLDAVIIQADHVDYKNLDFNKFKNLKCVFDGRNFIAETMASNLMRIGA